jgi:hypothetical protein
MQVAMRVFWVLLAFSFRTGAQAADSTSGASAPQWKLEDISVFRNQFLAVDRSFTPEARAIAERRVSELERTSEAMSGAAFAVELCRIAALADNGHTKCLPTWLGREVCRQWAVIEGSHAPGCPLQQPDFEVPDFKSVPISFYPFGEDFNVVTVRAKDADLLGSRLVAVENRSVEDLRAMLRTFSGGTTASRDLTAAEVLASPDQLHAVGLSRSDKSVLYELVMPSGRKVRRKFSVEQPSAAEPKEFRRLPDVDRVSWAFQEPDKPFRLRDAPEVDGVMVQLRQNVDASNQRLADFLREAEERRAALGRKNVVLDMRFNGGGNLMLTRDFMRQWPGLVSGRFYVLTSRRTLSAAIASIAYLKQAGSHRVVIIGEPVGDRLMFFSDGRAVQLPHSGRFFLTATARMDYRDGCRKYDDCFQGVAQPGRPTAPLPAGIASTDRMPISIDSLEPDIDAPWTIESWLKGTDPMMQAVTELVDKGSE